MALDSLLRHTVTIERRQAGAAYDDHGNLVGTFATVPDVPAFVQPIRAEETRVGGDYVIRDWRILLAPGTPLNHADQVLWDNRRFEVLAVEPVQGPGYLHHYAGVLREVLA